MATEHKQDNVELRLLIEDKKLLELYKHHIGQHNQRRIKSGKFADSGFDLLNPNDEEINIGELGHKFDLKIKAGLFKYMVYKWPSFQNNPGGGETVLKPIPFTIVPRSSTGANTPIRLSNSIGIIDAGYRGNLMMLLDNISNSSSPLGIGKQAWILEEGQRNFQVVSFCGSPIDVVIVSSNEGLGITSRGTDGFGSTGV